VDNRRESAPGTIGFPAHGFDDGVVCGEAVRCFLSDLPLADPHGELAAPAGEDLGVEIQVALQLRRHTDGVRAIVSALAVADPNRRHGSSGRAYCRPLAGLSAVRTVELAASGQSGVYAVVERVAVDPASGPAERIQVWGAFALMERTGRGFTTYVFRKPARGYMYFQVPAGKPEDVENARREWKDLASVAGTRQAVGFGYS
jgi:hypothetical protein